MDEWNLIIEFGWSFPFRITSLKSKNGNVCVCLSVCLSVCLCICMYICMYIFICIAPLFYRIMTSLNNKTRGVRAGHFNDGLFGKIAKGCNMVLHSWRPLPKENPSSNSEEKEAPTFFMSNLLKTDDKEEDKKFTGVHFFEICGVSTTEQNGNPLKRMKIAIKVNSCWAIV